MHENYDGIMERRSPIELPEDDGNPYAPPPLSGGEYSSADRLHIEELRRKTVRSASFAIYAFVVACAVAVPVLIIGTHPDRYFDPEDNRIVWVLFVLCAFLALAGFAWLRTLFRLRTLCTAIDEPLVWFFLPLALLTGPLGTLFIVYHIDRKVRIRLLRTPGDFERNF